MSTVSFGTALASCEGDCWPNALVLWEKIRSTALQVSEANLKSGLTKKKTANLKGLGRNENLLQMHVTTLRKLGDERKDVTFYMVDMI